MTFSSFVLLRKFSDVTQIQFPKKNPISVKKGDVLLGARGFSNKIKTEIIQKDSRKKISSAFFILKPDTKLIWPGYLYAQVSSKVFQNKLKKKDSGKVISHVLLKDLLNLNVSLETLQKQKSIAKKFLELDSKVKKSELVFTKARDKFLWDIMDERRGYANTVLWATMKTWRRFLNVIPQNKRQSIIKQFEKKEKKVLQSEKQFLKNQKQLEKFKI
jgi:restriction endonuclease S subunit